MGLTLWTEAKVQRILMSHYLKQQLACVPNTKALWAGYRLNQESDLVVIDKKMFANEIEIKTSYTDYKADFKKKSKHQKLVAGRGPRKFSYCCPDGLIAKEEVPAYAGLIYVTKYGPKVIKRAPKLNDTKITQKIYHQLFRSMCWKFTK